MPEPLAPLVTVSHEAELVAVQEHAAGVVTLTAPDEASAPDEMDPGEMETSHVPACSTVSVRPAMVTVPVLGEADVLAATAYVTAPSPLLFGPPPDVIEIHDVLLVADQTQAVGILTLAMPFPPGASNDSVGDDRDGVHAAAPCVTDSRRPAIATDPVRVAPAGFGSTR